MLAGSLGVLPSASLGAQGQGATAASTSRSTARRPTSPAAASPIPAARSSARRCCCGTRSDSRPRPRRSRRRSRPPSRRRRAHRGHRRYCRAVGRSAPWRWAMRCWRKNAAPTADTERRWRRAQNEAEQRRVRPRWRVCRPAARSRCRSSSASMPTDSRSRPSVRCPRRRVALPGSIAACVMVAGCADQALDAAQRFGQREQLHALDEGAHRRRCRPRVRELTIAPKPLLLAACDLVTRVTGRPG